MVHNVLMMYKNLAVIGSLLLLAGCAAVPQAPARPVLYDFGPGWMGTLPASTLAPLSPLVLADVQGAGQADASTAVQYRLAYADARQLRSYQLARWNLPPAQLLEQILRSTLGQRRAVLRATDARAAAPGATGVRPAVLRVQLEEFSQVFTSTTDSVGLVRVRATALVPSASGDQLLGQRVFTVQQPAASADAAGGTHALAEAASLVVQDIAQWLQEVQH